MNKRIIELAETAQIMAREKTSKDFIPGLFSSGVFREKFAELIIKECVNVVNMWSNEKPCSEGYDIMTVHKIKEHFGIE